MQKDVWASATSGMRPPACCPPTACAQSLSRTRVPPALAHSTLPACASRTQTPPQAWQVKWRPHPCEAVPHAEPLPACASPLLHAIIPPAPAPAAPPAPATLALPVACQPGPQLQGGLQERVSTVPSALAAPLLACAPSLLHASSRPRLSLSVYPPRLPCPRWALDLNSRDTVKWHAFLPFIAPCPIPARAPPLRRDRTVPSLTFASCPPASVFE